MAVGHQDMEEWGVYSIFKEAGRLLYQHIRILRPFILAFLLPQALILFLEVIGLAWFLTWVAEKVEPHHFEGIFDHHHQHRHSGFHAFLAVFFKVPNSPVELLLPVYVVTFVVFIMSWLFVSLAIAAIAKAIHHIYSFENEDSSQTLIQSIFTSLPHSMYRIFILSLCFFVIDILIYFLLALPFYFLSGPRFEPANTLHALYTWLWNLVFLILNFCFLLSVQVAVFESQYSDWAVLQRSAKLVNAKVATAIGLLAVYFVYFYILNGILLVAIMIPTHLVMLYVVAGALAVVYLAFGAYWSVVVTMFYFVSKCKCSTRGEHEGWHIEGDLYEALDVAVEN